MIASRWTPTTYKTRNRAEYSLSLKQRGSLSIWFDPEMAWEVTPSGRRGRKQTYSDAAIQASLICSTRYRRTKSSAALPPMEPIIRMMRRTGHCSTKAHAVRSPRKNAKMWKPDTLGTRSSAVLKVSGPRLVAEPDLVPSPESREI